MALKIIEGLQTVQAFKQGFTGGGAELGDHFGIGRLAVGAAYDLSFAQERPFIQAAGFGRRNTECAQFLSAGFRHPVGRPSRL